jgi:hypothetical protein
MYNIFKRPMFKLGGMTQGTGIMSHVEPRPQYFNGGRIMAQGGYDPRGTYFGYGADPRGTYFGPGAKPTTTFNPVNTVADIEALTGTGTGQSQSAFEKGQAARREAMNRAVKFGKYVPAAASTASQFGAGFLGPAVTGGLTTLGLTTGLVAPIAGLAYAGRPRNQSELNYIKNTIPPSEASGEGDYDAYMAGKTAAYNEGVAKGEKELGFFEGFSKPTTPETTGPVPSTTGLNQFRGITGQGTITTSVDPLTGDLIDNTTGEVIKSEEKPEQKPDAAKPAVYKEADPRAEIKKEADLIRETIGDEASGGELALIVSRALATPGTIADKIRAATELAIPLVKEKRKGRREIALKAYEAFKDKEKTQIAAGKKGDVGQLVDTYVTGKIKSGDKRDPAIIANEFIEERYLGAGKEEGALQRVIFSEDYKNDIRPAIVKVNKLERQKQSTGKLSKEEQKMLDDSKAILNQAIKKYPQFKELITTETLATGGRVGLAEGTQPEPVIEETVMKEGPSDVAIKPVNKLSYSELRDRLPKEITDDIVQLVASSEEALQDFAYIRTQRDINDFNVKYGVNLILPATR